MTATPQSALLFAAGLGTRMLPLTETMPKPLIKVAGRALLDHARAQCAGMRQVVNTHYKADQIRAHLHGSDVQISDETDCLRETGGGLKHALQLLGTGPVVTMNTDAVWTTETALADLIDTWDGSRMEGLLLLVPRADAIGHTGTSGFDLGPDGRISQGPGYIYTGAQIITTDRLVNITETTFSMWDLWTGMLARGTLYGALYQGRWCDVGQPQSIQIAEDMLRNV